MSFFNKLKWILGLLLVFVLIVATNLIDRDNFAQVRDSIVTIYEDRLVANDLIFDMSEAIHQKHLAVVKMDTVFMKEKNKDLNLILEELIDRYEQTKLTTSEQRAFNNLKVGLSELQVLEKSRGANVVDVSIQSQVIQKIIQLESNLEKLSKIQLEEGRRQMKIGKGAMNSVELFTQMELYLLLSLAIVIQVIILYNPANQEDS